MNPMTSEVSRLSARAAGVARVGAQWARDGGELVRVQAARTSGQARGYAREHPVHVALAAVAAGALVYALARLVAGRYR